MRQRQFINLSPKAYSAATRFFFKHAGYSYDPKTETRLQGRWRCARELARAEHEAREYGLQFDWENDWSVDHQKEYDCYVNPETGEYEAPSTCESCTCISGDGNSVLASLGCIDDADDNYRRVIEAELASEALHTIRTKLDREANNAGDVPDAKE